MIIKPPITNALGRFFLESLISCPIDVAIIHPSNENAIGAIAAIHPVDFTALLNSTDVIDDGSPKIIPAIAIKIKGINFIIVYAFWKSPPNFDESPFNI